MRNLSSTAKVVMAAIIDSGGSKGYSWKKHETLAEETGRCVRIVSKCVTELIEKGYLTSERRHSTSSIYTIGPKLTSIALESSSQRLRDDIDKDCVMTTQKAAQSNMQKAAQSTSTNDAESQSNPDNEIPNFSTEKKILKVNIKENINMFPKTDSFSGTTWTSYFEDYPDERESLSDEHVDALLRIEEDIPRLQKIYCNRYHYEIHRGWFETCFRAFIGKVKSSPSYTPESLASHFNAMLKKAPKNEPWAKHLSLDTNSSKHVTEASGNQVSNAETESGEESKRSLSKEALSKLVWLESQLPSILNDITNKYPQQGVTLDWLETRFKGFESYIPKRPDIEPERYKERFEFVINLEAKTDGWVLNPFLDTNSLSSTNVESETSGVIETTQYSDRATNLEKRYTLAVECPEGGMLMSDCVNEKVQRILDKQKNRKEAQL